jgi:hypothetical protein
LILSGSYTGRVHGIFRPLNLIWRGKVFTGTKATNRILGMLLVEGHVTSYGSTVRIDYPQFGLSDVLFRRAGDTWDGSMAFGWLVVHFTLTKEDA